MMSETKKYISKAPIRRLMKDEGCNFVSNDVIDMLINQLKEVASEVTRKAISNVILDNRKRITGRDIREAIRE